MTLLFTMAKFDGEFSLRRESMKGILSRIH